MNRAEMTDDAARKARELAKELEELLSKASKQCAETIEVLRALAPEARGGSSLMSWAMRDFALGHALRDAVNAAKHRAAKLTNLADFMNERIDR